MGLVSGPLFVAANLLESAMTALVLLNLGLFVFGGEAAVSYNAIQVIAPPGARGKVASLVVLACAIISYAHAPLFVALVIDFLLSDTSQIGISLVLVQSVFVTIGIAAFASGIAPLSRISGRSV
jgi:hypothetical protein